MKNLIEINCCPACTSRNILSVFKKDRFPIILFPVEKGQQYDVPFSQLSVSLCNDCQHMFIDKIDKNFNKAIYSDFYHLYPFSNLESMNDKYRKPFYETFEYLFSDSLSQRQLLEIGCSDESQLQYFLDKKIKCTGISPGALQSDRVVMIDNFYEAYNFKKKFDICVSRFNLEHIIEPAKFLKKIHNEIKDSGILLIQVPNEEFLVQSGILNIFAHEHTQYFNKNSLRKLLETNGFEVFLMRGQGEPSLIACARHKSIKFDPLSEFHKQKKITHNVKQIIDESEASEIIFYGAGLSLSALFYNENLSETLNNIKIIDDNNILLGRCLPYSNIEIESFSEKKFNNQSVIFYH